MNEIVIYRGKDGNPIVNVTHESGQLWLTQKGMATLFDVGVPAISKHLRNIFDEGELIEESVISKKETTASDGKKYLTAFYSLDAIISVGYRVNSAKATQFRIWATEILRQYIVKGFALDDKRLKEGSNDYWKELLDRIRDIRSSEKLLYRQVLDLYATATDYDPKASESKIFFQIVQNKLHYAAHGHTAAEVIWERADSEADFMGLRTFKGDFPVKADVVIAKNYLDEKELKVLNNIVSGYFDFAEAQALRHAPMSMKDYIKQLNVVLGAFGNEVLMDAGHISMAKAKEKAIEEYRKFEVKTLSPVEKAYIDSIKSLNEVVKQIGKPHNNSSERS